MTRLFLACTAIAALAACGDTALERGVTGAAIGGGAAAVTGNSVGTGAAIGAGAGAASTLID
jgi:osmotically inducible lipoprotein OsmB